MQKILIAGCGDVGNELASTLKSAGHVVWGLRRSPDRLCAGINPIGCDLRKPLPPATLPAHIDQVVFLPTPGERREAAYRSIFIDGLNHLLDALATLDAPPTRLVFVSSTSVYGQDEGEQINESSATQPAGFAGRVLLEAESVARRSSIPCVVVRLAGIYGPGRRRLIDRVEAGVLADEQGNHYTNRIHRDDCAGVLAHVMQLKQPHETYIGVDNESAPLHAVMSWIATQLGTPQRRDDAAAEHGSCTGKRCQNARLTATGYRFKYPDFRAGYGELLTRPN